MKEIFEIELRNLEFYSRIGVAPQERRVGNHFRITVTIRYDANRFESEQLESSISYAEIYQEIESVMNDEWLLLESVAQKISHCLKSRWESIQSGEVEIIKVVPPIAGMAGEAVIRYFF